MYIETKQEWQINLICNIQMVLYATGFIHITLNQSISTFNLQPCPMSEVQQGVLQTRIFVSIIIILLLLIIIITIIIIIKLEQSLWNNKLWVYGKESTNAKISQICPIRGAIQNIPDWCRHLYSRGLCTKNFFQQAKL